MPRRNIALGLKHFSSLKFAFCPKTELIHSGTASLPTLTFESRVGNNRRYRVMISTIDLDPKPVHRIPTWVMRKEDYLQASYFDTRIDRACRLCCLGCQVVKKGFVECEFHLLAWVSLWNSKNHLTRPFSQPNSPNCTPPYERLYAFHMWDYRNLV